MPFAKLKRDKLYLCLLRVCGAELPNWDSLDVATDHYSQMQASGLYNLACRY